MSDKQQQLAADDAAIEATELRATIRRQAETIKALQRALCEAQSDAAAWREKCNNVRLVAQANKDAALQLGEQLDEAAKSAEYWRGRCLGAESELAQIKSRLDCNGLADVAALPFGD